MPSAPSVRPAAPPAKDEKTGEEIDDGSNWTRAEIDAYNAEALEIFNEDALIKCPITGRTMTKEAFPKHWEGLPYSAAKNSSDTFPRIDEHDGTILYSREHAGYHKRKNRAFHWDMPVRNKPAWPVCSITGGQYSDRSM